jgi:mycothiol synthase
MFHVTVQVHPDYQRRGIGGALYIALLDAIKDTNPNLFKAVIYDGNEGGLNFARSRGFVEYSRRIDSVLDLQRFDSAPYHARIEALEVTGIRLLPMSALIGDAGRIYELQWKLETDVPIADDMTQPPIEQWRAQVVDNPSFLPSASFIALDGDEPVGLTLIFDQGEGGCHVDLTGTLPSHRRRGIALAMKVRGIQWAQANGYKEMATNNDEINTGILKMNMDLGFVPYPACIQIEKRL